MSLRLVAPEYSAKPWNIYKEFQMFAEERGPRTSCSATRTSGSAVFPGPPQYCSTAGPICASSCTQPKHQQPPGLSCEVDDGALVTEASLRRFELPGSALRGVGLCPQIYGFIANLHPLFALHPCAYVPTPSYVKTWENVEVRMQKFFFKRHDHLLGTSLRRFWWGIRG